MEKIPFSESELDVVKEVKTVCGISRFYERPITEKENMRMLYYEDHPMWIPAGRLSNKNFAPAVIPDNIARAFVYDGTGFDNAKGGGKDMFGIPWVYVPVAGGSMEDPAFPHFCLCDGPFMEKECKSVLDRFFAEKRKARKQNEP